MNPFLSRLVWLAFCLAILPLHAASNSVVQMLVPGFTVEELPVELNNINNLRFAPDGRLTALGYDGKIWLLKDTNGDGLEDMAESYWDKPTLSVPLGMNWTTHGLFVASKGKISLLRDTDADGRADLEEIITSGWPGTDVASGGVDATAVTLDAEGNVYFGLLVANYANAYRLKPRKELTAEEKAWLEARGDKGGAPDEVVSLYDIQSKRGTIQKWNPRTKTLETLATGIRVPVGLAFNKAGDLFNTDQEGETWMPNGNPLDELNHIIAGKNYGFPPRHDQWLPNLVSVEPVIGFGPQHQSACGLVFNELHAAKVFKVGEIPIPISAGQKLFGPKWWEGDVFVAGESRGQIWRAKLAKNGESYTGEYAAIARLQMLITDVAISPEGALYVSCHSGPPDWGTGPNGRGKLFKITYTNPQAPQPVEVTPVSITEVQVKFDRAVDASVAKEAVHQAIEFGAFVSAGDQYETLKPPYVVVKQQDTTLRGQLKILNARLVENDRTLVLETGLHSLAVPHKLTLSGVKARGTTGEGETVDIDYDFKGSPLKEKLVTVDIRHLSPAAETKANIDLAGGDYENGRELFFKSEQLKCASCHQIRGEGKLIGPDLSNLIHRDAASVLRDIRDPNATLHPDYVAFRAILKNDEEVNGFVRAQTTDSVTLLGVDGKEVVVKKADLSSLSPGGVSLMPSGLLEGLPEAKMRDLLTFLLYAPPERSRAESAQITQATQWVKPITKLKPLNIVLVASKQDHGFKQHDYPAWQKQWQSLLGKSPEVTVEDAWLWPTEEQFKKADLVVFYYWNRAWDNAKYQQLDTYQERGGGIAVFHSATIEDNNAEKLAERLGLAAHPPRTKYLHAPMDLNIVAPTNHPITIKLPRKIHFLDEPYWPMIGNTNTVEVLATTAQEGKEWPMVWTYTKGKGRVFATILGHYSWTFDDPVFRVLALRGLAWAAGEPVNRLQDLANSSP